MRLRPRALLAVAAVAAVAMVLVSASACVGDDDAGRPDHQLADVDAPLAGKRFEVRRDPG